MTTLLDKAMVGERRREQQTIVEFLMQTCMNETPNTRTAELFDAMVAAYETWAEPLSAGDRSPL